MKTLTLDLPDELFERLERRAVRSGISPREEVLDVLQRATGPTADLSAARARMRELFRTVNGFRLGTKIPREELHERGSLR